jgi:hypothetical protein
MTRIPSEWLRAVLDAARHPDDPPSGYCDTPEFVRCVEAQDTLCRLIGPLGEEVLALRALLAEATTHLDHLRWLMVQEPPANRAKLTDLLARIRALETK